jgi:hypothetical protein
MNHFHSILRNFKNATLTVVFCFISNSIIQAQITISSSGTSYSESFNGLGTASNASLPTNWKVQSSSSTTQWTGMSFSTGSGAVTHSLGNNMSTTASGGIYRFNANGSTSESALGGLSSGSAAKTVVFMAEFINSGALAISSLNIAYNIEKYRNGTNSAGFSIGLFYILQMGHLGSAVDLALSRVFPQMPITMVLLLPQGHQLRYRVHMHPPPQSALEVVSS